MGEVLRLQEDPKNSDRTKITINKGELDHMRGFIVFQCFGPLDHEVSQGEGKD